MDPLMASIQLFPFSFVPIGWLLCNGQSLPTAQYQALYSLIGNTYGGNSTTFMLPNLSGAEPLPTMHYYIAIDGMYPQRQ